MLLLNFEAVLLTMGWIPNEKKAMLAPRDGNVSQSTKQV